MVLKPFDFLFIYINFSEYSGVLLFGKLLGILFLQFICILILKQDLKHFLRCAQAPRVLSLRAFL